MITFAFILIMLVIWGLGIWAITTLDFDIDTGRGCGTMMVWTILWLIGVVCGCIWIYNHVTYQVVIK